MQQDININKVECNKVWDLNQDHKLRIVSFTLATVLFKLSHLMKNQQNEFCAQQRLRSAWAFAVRMKKARVLSYPLSAQWRLIRLGGCQGWSESLLGAHAILLVSSRGNSLILETERWYRRTSTSAPLRPLRRSIRFYELSLNWSQINKCFILTEHSINLYLWTPNTGVPKPNSAGAGAAIIGRIGAAAGNLETTKIWWLRF